MYSKSLFFERQFQPFFPSFHLVIETLETLQELKTYVFAGDVIPKFSFHDLVPV